MLQKLSRVGHISQSSMRDVAERGLSALRRLQSLKEKGQEQMEELVGAVEVGASAYAFGFARGYFAKPGQDVEILGVPVDLAGGIALHVLALFGGAGRYKADLHNFANGGLASYATTMGLKQGVDQAAKHPPSQLLGTSAASNGWFTAGGMPGVGYDPSGLSSTLARAAY